MKKDNSAKSLPVKASKYPTKRTVNLAQRESHSRSTLTLTLGLVLIVVLSFCVANFGVLRQLDRQRAAENAYNTVHSQYTQMQQALADSMRMLNENAPNDQVIKLKALEALEKVADGKATKIIIPSEIQGLAGLAASTKALVEGDKAE